MCPLTSLLHAHSHTLTQFHTLRIYDRYNIEFLTPGRREPVEFCSSDPKWADVLQFNVLGIQR